MPQGFCNDRFAPVQAAFEANFANGGEVGACVAISLEGEMVVDLWDGYRDAASTEPWQEDTIINVYSTTKTMSFMTALLLADRGELDLYAPVSRYWPEFAANGKEAVEVRHLLSHNAGLSGTDEMLAGADVYDWDRVTAALAAQAPWWPPGTQSGYHAMTQGFLIGEVVRRITGETLGTVFRTEIAEPLGADFHIGTPPEHHHRIAELVPPTAAIGDGVDDPNSVAARTFRSPAVDVSETRGSGWREAEIPAANGHGNARSVVRAQTPMANGGSAWGKQIMSEEGTRRIFDEQSHTNDLVLGVPLRFGMGYGLTSADMPMGPNPHIAYWGGYGGSTIVVDQDARMCVSYVMNRMEAGALGDPRGFSILQAAYESIA